MRAIRSTLAFAAGLIASGLVITTTLNPASSPYMDRESALSYVRLYVVLAALVSSAAFFVSLARGHVECAWPRALGAGVVVSLALAVLIALLLPFVGAWHAGAKLFIALCALLGIPYLAGWLLGCGKGSHAL
jgi:hypothetical protein